MTRRFSLLFIALLLLSSCGTDGAIEGEPPQLTIDVSVELNHTVGEGVIRITLQAEDPEGGPVEFEVIDGPERAELNESESWAVFTWDPTAADVTEAGRPMSLVFAATDREGLTTEKIVRVNISAGNGIPKFLNSNSVLHNVSSGDPIAFDVTVRDDDSSSVNIRMPGGFAPEGAALTKTSEFSSRFGWQPDAEQLQQRVHTIKFIANDGQNDPVEQDVTIILKKETDEKIDVQEREPTDCYFEDRVTYASLGAQRGTQPYTIEASFTALGAQNYDRIVVNYTEEDAWNLFDVGWKSKTMSEEGSTFSADITNPLLQEGESKEYYYEICAVDDEPEDERNAIICGPTSLYESFVAYAPNQAGCLDDRAVRGNNFDNATPLEYDFALMRLCPDAADYFEIGIGSNQEGYVYIVYPLGRRPAISVYDANQQLDAVQPSFSDCSGFAQISVENLGGPTKKYILVEPDGEGSDITYQIFGVTSNLGTDDNCADADNEPNDDADLATVITTQSAMFSGLEICRPSDVDVFAIEATEGQLIDIDVAFTHSIGDLDITLFSPSEKADVSRTGYGSDWSLSYEDEENIDFIAEESGTHYLVVYSEDNPNSYTLRLEVTDTAPMCSDDDAYGNNHTQGAAANLTPDTYTGLEICSGSEDWYSFVKPSVSISTYLLELEVTSGNLGDITFEVWDSFMRLETATVQANKLVIPFDPPSFGTFYPRVIASGDVNYTLTISAM